MEKDKNKLVIIDANALVHRAFHALPPLSSEKGELTNAVFGFTSILIKVINEIKPDYMVACFDLPEPTFRHEEFSEYKAHRQKTPEDLIPQFEKVKEVLRAFGVPVFEKAGFEAEDLLGTLSLLSQKQDPNIENIILTGDLDTLQLVDDNTFVYTLKRGITDTVMYDKKAVMDRFEGLTPEQMIDFKGLKGDPSDNIPGVPGVGEKTAIKLLIEYKTLDGVYENIGLIPKKLADKLEENKDQAFFSKKLATIIRDVEGVEFSFEDAKFEEYDKEKVKKLFSELNFFTLIPRLNGSKEIEEKKEDHHEKIGIREFSENDIEKMKKADIVFVSVFSEKEMLICLSERDIFKVEKEKIKDILEDEKIKKGGHDLKEISKALFSDGIFIKGLFFDVMIASYLLSPGLRSYKLQKILLEFLSKDISEENIEKYAAFYSFSVFSELKKRLKNNELFSVFEDIEMPLIPVLVKMELAGIKLNAKKLEKMSGEIAKLIDKKEKEIYKLAKKEFNINSSQQMGVVLFEDLKIQGDKKVKKTKKTGAYSTGESELEKYKDQKIIKDILEYRELAKLKSTYVDSLPKLINKDTGRLHSSFNQAGTATGRVSSSDPNLQNIPQKGDFSKEIRDAFEAEKGYSFLAFDYSQIELRIIASISGDKKMIDIFKDGGDIHAATAAEINNINIKDVTKKMRYAAKALNFGILFGMGIKGFSESAGIEMSEAKRFIEEYFKKFAGIKDFIDNTLEFAKKNGFIKTETGRKRWLPDLNSKNWILRNAAERMAQNLPAQGLEADILKLAMIKINENILEKYKEDDIKIILQIHDELIFEVKDDIIEKVKDHIKRTMEEAYALKVPVLVELSIGKKWGAMKHI